MTNQAPARRAEKFFIKGVMEKAGIPPSFSEETVRMFLQKAGLKWARVQRKGFLIKIT